MRWCNLVILVTIVALACAPADALDAALSPNVGLAGHAGGTITVLLTDRRTSQQQADESTGEWQDRISDSIHQWAGDDTKVIFTKGPTNTPGDFDLSVALQGPSKASTVNAKRAGEVVPDPIVKGRVRMNIYSDQTDGATDNFRDHLVLHEMSHVFGIADGYELIPATTKAGTPKIDPKTKRPIIDRVLKPGIARDSVRGNMKGPDGKYPTKLNDSDREAMRKSIERAREAAPDSDPMGGAQEDEGTYDEEEWVETDPGDGGPSEPTDGPPDLGDPPASPPLPPDTGPGTTPVSPE